MLLSASDRVRLQAELSRRLKRPVRVDLALDEGDDSKRAAELLDELCSLSPLLAHRLAPRSADTHLPSLVLSGAALGAVRFTGLPIGYEFPTLIDALIAVSTGDVDLGPSSRQRVAELDRDRHLRVFTTPT